MGQFEKTWHHDEQGRRTHNAEAAEPDSGRCPQIWTSSSTLLTDTLLALSGNQTVDAQGCRDEITGNDPGHVGDYVSIWSGSLSPNLGEMWRYGCPRSRDWDSDGEDVTVECAEEKGGGRT